MEKIVEWCNLNNGFLTAVLSVIGLLLSTIAIIVSIKTARLPYKKKLKLSSSIDMALWENSLISGINSKTIGITVNVANIGSRNVNITYLGIGHKDKKANGGFKKFVKLKDAITGTGIIMPTEIKSEFYKTEDLIPVLAKIKPSKTIHIYVVDSEGKTYKKRIGYVSDLKNKLF